MTSDYKTQHSRETFSAHVRAERFWFNVVLIGRSNGAQISRRSDAAGNLTLGETLNLRKRNLMTVLRGKKENFL